MAKPPPNKPPVPILTLPPTAVVGEIVTADPTASSDPDGQIASMDLLWGDEPTKVPLATREHVFLAPGTYTVTLTVYDTAGKAAKTTQPITISSATPPPPMGVAPAITEQPVGVTVEWGQQALVSVKATGTEPLTYQWYLGTGPLTGQTNPVLQYTPTASGQVRCRVSNAVGAVDSATATVQVKMPVSPPATGVGLAYRRTIRMPSMYASFNYGDCTGRINDKGNQTVIFSGDQVNQGAPIYELEITDAPVASWAGGWERPYGGKRGTWVQPSALAQDIDRLHAAVTTFSHGTPEEVLKAIRALGTDVTIEKAANAAVINKRMLAGVERKTKSGEWTYWDFDDPNQGFAPIVNGAHYWHNDLLYVCYADTYNVSARPDCNMMAMRLLPDGKTECFGPWRFKSITNGGWVQYSSRAGGGPKPHPVTGKMLISGGMNSGNASCPWGANLAGGADWPDETTPTHQTLEMNLECFDNYLYSYPMIGQFTMGVPNGPIKSMRRPLHPAMCCAYEGQPDENHADPLKNNGIGSWTDSDGQAGFIPLPDRLLYFVTVAGSPIQDPTNPLAAHVWYSTVLNNPPFTCVHGIPSPVQITGPVKTAAFPGIVAYPWSELNKVLNKEIEDWTPEPEWVNAEAQWGMVTADITDIGGAKGLSPGPVRDGLVYMIAQHADTVSYPGIAVPLIHEFELV